MIYEDTNKILDSAEVELKIGNFAKTENLCKKIIDEFTYHPIKTNAEKISHIRAFRLYSVSLLRRGRLKDALPLAEKALELSLQAEHREEQAKSIGTIGNIYRNLADYSRALEYNRKALELYEVLGIQKGIAKNLNSIGNIYFYIANYPIALEHYGKALAIAEELNEKDNIASSLGNIGIVYDSLADYPNALEYFQKALLINEELGRKDGIANNLGSIGIVYRILSDYPKALEFHGKALLIMEELEIEDGIARNLSNIANVYELLSDYPKALEFYNRSLGILEKLGRKEGVARNFSNIGVLFANKNFEGYDYVKAEEYFLKAISLCREISSKHLLYSVHKSLSELYEQEGQWRDSHIQFKNFYELEKEVQSEEAKKQADKLAYERRDAEREKQLATEHARFEEREKIIDELTELNSSLQEANRQKNEVLGIVAHDLKNPLAAISLSSGTLTRYLPMLNQDEILDQLGRIKSTAERMNQIILNLLDIQKLEFGKQLLVLESLKISAILHSVVNSFQNQAEKKNINIQTEIPDFLIALAENSAFQEVLENLISNAIKFSPFDKNIFVRAESNDQFIRISIQDEGPGLTDEDKSKLFGQFTRLSAKPTGGEHSTGLGLSIVKRMVEMMNGKIWCESEVGKGATFIVELPKSE